MIDENNSLETLILKNCKLKVNGLLLLADVLTKITSPPITHLDISENYTIQDPQYKVLLGLLNHNKTLLHIEYTLVDEENIEKRKKFTELQEQGVETD
jgi:hypothetical protein